MKIFLKILKISVIVFFSIIGLLLIAGWIMQDKITKMAIEMVGESIDAPIGMKNVRLSLIKRFPHASIEFDEMWIGALPEGDSTKTQPLDTLAKFNKLFVSVKTLDLLDNIFTVRKIELVNGFANYYVNVNGKSNIDFLMATDTTAIDLDSASVDEALNLTVDELSIKNFTCNYRDDQLKASVTAKIPKFIASAKMDKNGTHASARGEIKLTNLKFEETNLYRMQETIIEFDVIHNSDTVRVNSFQVATDGLTLDGSGKVAFGDDIYTDLAISMVTPSLSSLTKYIPDEMLEELQISQISGAFSLKTNVKGLVTDESIPHYEAFYDLTNGAIQYQNYPMAYNMTLNGSANNGELNNNQTTAINLNQFAADFSGNHLDVAGYFRNLDRLNYAIKSRIMMDLDASRALIPVDLVKSIGGKINARIDTKGVLPDSIDDQFIDYLIQRTQLDVQFKNVDIEMDSVISIQKMSAQVGFKDQVISLNGLNLTLPEYDLRLVNNSFKMKMIGKLSNMDKMDLQMSSFYFATPESSIKGAVTIKDFQKVSFSVETDIDLDLAFAKQFAPDSMVNDMKGRVLAKIKSKGNLHLDSIADQMEDILYDQSVFDIEMKNINLDMTDTLMNVKNLSGTIHVDDQLISIGKLGGDFLGINFSIDTTRVKNLFNTALRNRPGTLEVEGSYSLGDLDYEILGGLVSSEETETAVEADPEPLNWNYKISGSLNVKSLKYDNIFIEGLTTSYETKDSIVETKGKLSIRKLKYDNANLSNISGLYNLKDTVYTIDQLKFNGFGGSGNTSMKILMHPNEEMLVQMKAQIGQMNVRTLLKEMDNLYQEEITYEQMSGIVTTDNFYLQMKMIGDSIVFPDIRMSMDLKFEDGGIYNYPVIQDMVQYLPSIDNLDTLAFKTITSNLFVFQDAIYIPETFVVTNAFDVHAIGKQTFGEDYQYHIGVSLSDILKGKSKKKEKKQEAMGNEVVDEKRKFTWVQSTGRKGKYTNGLDKDEDRNKMKNDIRGAHALLRLRFTPTRFKFETDVQQ